MLPLFLSTLFAADYSDLYAVFDMPVNHYRKWAQKDKRSYLKDLFIWRYRLPHNSRKFDNHIPVVKVKSVAKENRSYYYAYLNIKRHRSLKLLLQGVKKGSLMINGEPRGEITGESYMDYAVIQAGFVPGRYLFSISCEDCSDIVTPLLISNQKIEISEKRAFNSRTSASIKIINAKKKGSPLFEILYQGWCFPSEKESKMEFYLKKTYDKQKKKQREKTLFEILVHAQDRSAVTSLKKAGFSDSMIKWWRNMTQKKTVCGYE